MKAGFEMRVQISSKWDINIHKKYSKQNYLKLVIRGNSLLE